MAQLAEHPTVKHFFEGISVTVVRLRLRIGTSPLSSHQSNAWRNSGITAPLPKAYCHFCPRGSRSV